MKAEVFSPIPVSQKEEAEILKQVVNKLSQEIQEHQIRFMDSHRPEEGGYLIMTIYADITILTTEEVDKLKSLIEEAEKEAEKKDCSNCEKKEACSDKDIPILGMTRTVH